MSQAFIEGREAEADLHAHVCAYNMAFEELGLRFRWDARTLASLASIEDEATRIVTYIETHHPHLLKAYSPEFLSHAILTRKNAQRPEPLPILDTAIHLETNRPSVVQVRARDTQVQTDYSLPMLAGT
ncbi:hypothetical protein GWC77_24365 [Paraburkholderia sp. NMBU_R16]|uniref:hypothetical protein n=1 Tax=Paraburkholderia sp. NMBU_R16 TaxID=2698676 RepID=UPI001564B2BC|nr:hypothetical protein [Paraburkholderia sp. NMBU_R16]NRO99042.1 hypothetical protein [Paraburkholderia sp. NMBU_R16]